MRGETRHWPFESKYLRDFEVVEERRNGLRLFPHTDQLPLLSKAINREFEFGLTSRLVYADHRADHWRKLQLYEAVQVFCSIINAARPDRLHVSPYYTPELLTRIAVVQHITETCPGGLAHRFRFFRDESFLPDVHLAGKQMVFASHVMDRYEERALRTAYHPLAMFLIEFFGSAKLPVRLLGNRPGLAFLTGGSMVAMPYKETAHEYFFLSTLSPVKIDVLTIPEPLPPMHLHYGPTYQPPAKCINRDVLVELIQKHWRDKAPPRDERDHERQLLEHMSFNRLVRQIDRVLRQEGHDEQSRLVFQDGIHGPFVLIGDQPRPGSDWSDRVTLG